MDPFILEKFIKEGSYATLFMAWWDKQTNIFRTPVGELKQAI